MFKENLENLKKIITEIEKMPIDVKQELMEVQSNDIEEVLLGFEAKIKANEEMMKLYKEKMEKMKEEKKEIEDKIIGIMIESNINELETNTGRIKLSVGNGAVNVLDEEKIDKKFFEEKTKMVLNKKLLNQELKKGEKVDGAELIYNPKLLLK